MLKLHDDENGKQQKQLQLSLPVILNATVVGRGGRSQQQYCKTFKNRKEKLMNSASKNIAF
ncbi:hypothetical protein BLA29_011852 [Euroglyphus maynei]|uniref:Uncharacterized protein n=1 Tax=Euroglyphus maynei TaxID=6958 RepID=A0A1Y3BKU7_EURMA|nr:hypothetical protein BLA29_011852 [Euroglyphus maynei]